jgi:hypothetical protein
MPLRDRSKISGQTLVLSLPIKFSRRTSLVSILNHIRLTIPVFFLQFYTNQTIVF